MSGEQSDGCGAHYWARRFREHGHTVKLIAPQISAAHPVCQRLETIPGIGLVPRQHSTGGKPRLFGISKRGDMYLMMRGAYQP